MYRYWRDVLVESRTGRQKLLSLELVVGVDRCCCRWCASVGMISKCDEAKEESSVWPDMLSARLRRGGRAAGVVRARRRDDSSEANGALCSDDEFQTPGKDLQHNHYRLILCEQQSL